MRSIAALAVAGVLLAGAPSPTKSELQRAADRLIATSDIPAVITLVEQDGKRTVVAAGYAEIGGRKARADDRFWVGSITKTFVATVVMQLVAEHKLGLDDRVSTLLPGTPSRRTTHPPPESAQPHERHPQLHGARAVEKRRRARTHES